MNKFLSIAFILLFYAGHSFANDQFFYTKYLNGTGNKYSTGWDACRAEYPASAPWTAGGRELSDGSWMCQHGCVSGACDIGKLVYKHLNPDYVPSCPEGQTWNPDIGFCVENDPCADLAGTSSGFKQSGNSSDPDPFYRPIPGSKYWSSPNFVVTNGCSMTVKLGTRCKVYGNGDYVCVGNAVYTGETASPENSNVGPSGEDCSGVSCPPTDPVPTSTGDSECTNWVNDAEGRRTRTCETTAEAAKPGQAACLTDGSLVCVSPAPTPESDTKTRVDDVKETTLADGGKKTETTSTTTKTYCLAGACNTTNTTNKTTVVTNGSGDVVSESGSCEGDNCQTPETPEEEKDQAPEQADLPEVGDDGDLSYSDSLDNFIDRVNGSPLISAVNSIAFPTGGGSCNMGSASLWGGSISFNSFCTMAPDILGGLRFLFLSIWAIAAVRLFMTA
jgi:hypothetical protein